MSFESEQELTVGKIVKIIEEGSTIFLREHVKTQIANVISVFLGTVEDEMKVDIQEIVMEELSDENEKIKDDLYSFIDDNLDIAVAARDGNHDAAKALVKNFIRFSRENSNMQTHEDSAALLNSVRPPDYYKYI